MGNKSKAFTLRGKGRLGVLVTPCGVGGAFVPSSGGKPSAVRQYNAIWDTGATECVISARVASDLSLKPYGMQHILTAAGLVLTRKYMVSLFLPNGVAFTSVTATEGNMGATDVLVGMSIISCGDFAITHQGGDTAFSFQIPSTHHIDFVEEGKEGVE